MKKLILYLITLSIVGLPACKKDDTTGEEQPNIDPRDKYVGHYVGLGVEVVYYGVPNNAGQFAEIYLTKHPSIDNALQITGRTNPPIVEPNYFGFGGFGGYDTYYYLQDEKNRLYISDKGFLYQKNMNFWDFYKAKLCRFSGPDSLYCLINYRDYQTGGTFTYHEFFVKVKKVE